ncbi:MAG: hypothetical protein JXA14_26120 [Anaerolineae bacterium]|nr:hypothetical protein [Anaerolineae bacterium]
MTYTHKFIEGDSGDEVSIIAGEQAGWRLEHRGWLPRSAKALADRIAPPVLENLSLVCEEDSFIDFADQVQALDRLRETAERYISNMAQKDPVWWYLLENAADAQPLRATVRSIDLEWKNDRADSCVESPKIARFKLAVLREPYWEAPTRHDLAMKEDTVIGWIGSVDLTDAGGGGGDVPGDTPARMKWITFSLDDGEGAAITGGRIWAGFRSANRHPNLGNFDFEWPCESGTNGTDTSTQADADARNNSMKQVTFATEAGWAKRVIMKMSTYTANYSDQIGRFLRLLRAKVGASTTVEIQLRYGYSGMADADYIQGRIVEFENTSYDVIAMDAGDVPLYNTAALADMLLTESEYTIQIWARRTAGSGYLYLDEIGHIPVDESYLVTPSGYPGTAFHVFVDPLNRITGLSSILAVSLRIPVGFVSLDYSPNKFAVPTGDSRLVVAYARLTLSDDGDEISFYGDQGDNGPTCYPRWYNIRGDEECHQEN